MSIAAMILNSENKKPINLRAKINPANSTRILALAAASFVLLFVVGQLAYFLLPDFLGRDFLYQEFHLGGEGNLPALFAGILLFFCHILLYLISVIEGRKNNQQTKRWFALSIIFLYLSVDEIASLHERAGTLLDNIGDFNGFLYYSWVLSAVVILPILGLIFSKFIRNLPRSTRNQFLIAAFIYIGGAVGIEAISGNYNSLYGRDNIVYTAILTMEEACEMFGLVVFINALIKYIVRSKTKHINLQLLFEGEDQVVHHNNFKS